MTTSKHTPGPWLTFGNGITADDPRRPGWTLLVAQMTDMSIRPDGGSDYYIPDEEAKANANLIASAPELLEALRDAADYMGEMGHPVEVLRRARAAIAKAEGK